MALRDYAAWHDEYDRPGSALHLRLLVVQDLIASALDELPRGPVRVISMCAGQGRDLIGVARRHRRGPDLTGVLVEADPRNAAAARTAIAQAGLDGLRVIEGDAGRSGTYAGARPADLVLACGVFGNISDADIRRTIGFIPALCAPGAWVVWTRKPTQDRIVLAIQGWFEQAGFRPLALVVPDGDLFGVGAARFTGSPTPPPHEAVLFEFVQ
jgi:hypothetical protein